MSACAKDCQEKVTWLEVMKGYDSTITEDEANYILWNETCYPFDTVTALKQIKEYFQKRSELYNARN